MLFTSCMSKKTFILILALSVPALLLIFNHQWFYTFRGMIDPFMYMGYFKYYFQHEAIRHMDEYYKSSRLPWIIPGSLAFQLFNYKTAHFVLNFSLLYYIYFSFYFLAKRLFSPITAGIVLLLLCFYSEIHGSGGWKYHMMISIAYQLTSLIFLVRWLDKEDFLSAFLSGVFFICAVHNHPPYLATLSLNAFLIFDRKAFRVGPYLRYGLIFAFGAGAMTVSLMLYSFVNGYSAYFFMPQIRYMRSLQKTADTGIDWIFQSRHLVFTASVYVYALFIALSRIWAGKYRFRPMQISFLFLTSVFILLQWKGQAVLQSDYQAILLSPFAFLAFAEMFDSSEYRAKRQFLAFCFLLFLFGISAYLYLTHEFIIQSFSYLNEIFQNRHNAILIPILLTLASFAVIRFSKRNNVLRLLGYISLIFIFSGFMNRNPSDYSWQGRKKYNGELVNLADKIDDFVHKVNPNSLTKFWYDVSETKIMEGNNVVSVGLVYTSLSSYYGWCGAVLNCGSPNKFPKISKEELDQHPDSFFLAVVSLEKKVLRAAEEALMTDHQRKILVVEETEIVGKNFTFYAAVMKVDKTGSQRL